MGHIFLDHIILVAAVHANVHHIIRFDIVEGELEGHNRINATCSHDLVAYAWLLQSLDALHSREHVRQPELMPLATVKATAVEEANHVEIHQVHTVDPIVDLGLMPSDPYGNVA